MGKGRILAALVAAFTVTGVVQVVTALADTGSPTIRTISGGTVLNFRSQSVTGGSIQWPEFRMDAEEQVELQGAVKQRGIVNRSLSHGNAKLQANAEANAPTVAAAPVVLPSGTGSSAANPSWEGLNHFQQRFANGGNQFSLEPPDQGLCVGGNSVMETVNDVMAVYDRSGSLQGLTDQNTFYGYPAAINRTTGVQGPFVTDPNCLYDPGVNRFFHTALTLEVDAAGDFTGKNHLDLAVSQSNNPLGAWKIYRIAAQDDGTDGTPNHHCAGGPCIGDYPQIGADATGFYITTNEYPFFANGFQGAQVYAFPKAQLAAWADTLTIAQFDTATSGPGGKPGFTLWPAKSPGTNQFATAQNGTEYFLSSTAAEEAGGNGSDNRIGVWALTGTNSLGAKKPTLSLFLNTQTVEDYAFPGFRNQRSGSDWPLGQCINDTSMVIQGLGSGCWRFFFNSNQQPQHNEVISSPDQSDSRMLTSYYSNGLLYGALDTLASVNGQDRSAIAWFVFSPQVTSSGVSATQVKKGYLALAGNNLSYPSIAVTTGGKGLMGFSVMGDTFFPTPAYSAISSSTGTGTINVIVIGEGPADGFTSYKAFVGTPIRTRWGDYGMAVADGTSIWMANEYIAQTCNLTTYVQSNFLCGNSRSALGNWSTRISRVTP
jgi:hypothetical protein